MEISLYKPIFTKALKAGGTILEDGRAYIGYCSKKHPDRYIQKTIDRDGSYTIFVNEGGKLRKVIDKKLLPDGKSFNLNTWDSKTNKGVWLNIVEVLKGKSVLTKAHDKVSNETYNQEGIIYQWLKGSPRKNHQYVKMLCNMIVPQSTPPKHAWSKNFDPSENFGPIVEVFKNLFGN